MSVQIAFQRSDGSLVHKLICWWSKSEFAHCEVVVDGKGYGVKGSIDGLHVREEFLSWQWEFIPVDWDKYQVQKYIDANKDIGYDYGAIKRFISRIYQEDPLKQHCGEWVVNIGSYCHDPRFHNLDASRFKPVDIYQKLTGERK